MEESKAPLSGALPPFLPPCDPPNGPDGGGRGGPPPGGGGGGGGGIAAGYLKWQNADVAGKCHHPRSIFLYVSEKQAI